VEVSASAGYTASEGITSEDRELVGALFDSLNVESGASFNFTFGVFATEQAEVEFLFAMQDSGLEADGPGGPLAVSELTVYNYMGNFVYNWGTAETRVRPFLFAGLGATNYSFGSNLLPNAAGDIEGETKFAWNLGGGVKFYFAPNVGVRVGARWTPTYIKSDPAGIWCDPFFGCWQVVDDEYSNQFETSGGVTFRF
jgi:opacity protein-like surface antigen